VQFLWQRASPLLVLKQERGAYIRADLILSWSLRRPARRSKCGPQCTLLARGRKQQPQAAGPHHTQTGRCFGGFFLL
jgi:hypothetical protein